MSKWFCGSAIVVMAAITIGVVLRFVVLGDTAPADEDGRQGVRMSKSETRFVLAEMRDFLAGVQTIYSATLRQDRNAIAEAAAPLGREVAAHAPAGLMGKLPLGFKRLGFALHEDFDRIAKMAPHAEMVTIQKEVSDSLNKCVACHASFRIETE
ncbi:MAG: hypothetical protein OIF35_05550 [Cellvibrionaceae bacterium]|nr:hypothetical protein [Cellvibrionaceae bacterium]